MSWVKIDDGMPEHPKVQDGGPLAFAMDVAGLAYSNRHSTMGFLPLAKVRTLLDWTGVQADYIQPGDQDEGPRMSVALAEILRVCGRWHLAGEDECGCIPTGVSVDKGYWIHGYSDYQESPERALEIRKSRSQAGKKGAHRRWQTDSNVMATPIANEGQTDSNAMAKTCPVPVPVPVPKKKEEDGTRAHKNRGSEEPDTTSRVKAAAGHVFRHQMYGRLGLEHEALPRMAWLWEARFEGPPDVPSLRRALDSLRVRGKRDVEIVAHWWCYMDPGFNQDDPRYLSPRLFVQKFDLFDPGYKPPPTPEEQRKAAEQAETKRIRETRERIMRDATPAQRAAMGMR